MLALIGLWCIAAGCRAAPPQGAGFVKDHAYHSEYFHFVYAYPANTEPVDARSVSLPQKDPKGHAFWLFSARVGTQPEGILLYVDEVGHYKGQVRTGADYLAKVKRQWARPYFDEPTVNPCPDLTLYRMDYLEGNNDYNSAVAGVYRGYAIVFKFNANDQETLDTLANSVKGLRCE
jgi:hypothetical protein